MILRYIFAALGAVALARADSRLTNLSVRSVAGSGSETLIVGFAISGTGNKTVLLRGVGPSLEPFGINGVVADPQLWLFSASTQIDQNENWGGGAALDSAFSAVGAFGLPPGSGDAALLKSLAPGSYSAQLIANTGPGIALVECYDTDALSSGTRLRNVSARSVSGAGANILTVGFAISGPDARAVLIRGIGPTLASFGVGGTLGSARLRLFDSAGTEIGNNSGWTSFSTPSSVFNAVGAFALPAASKDGAILVGLPAGAYTAQVGDAAGTASGAALIEVYEVADSPVAYITLQPVVAAGLGAPFDAGAGAPSPGPDTQPAVISQARPSYPFELRAASLTGQALVDFYAKADGTVANAVAIRATDTRFAAAAVTAVQQWRFTAARRNGVLVTTHLQVPIVFALND